ncbi:MAG: ABC transporter ATP-binding protein, partial [Clostridiaceae bacterium]|nr:ABC transporter ATP-binding protein [Clostridiaceae bacterium]
YLDNISLNIPKGSIVGFIGENGAGKTTTIKAILNLISRNSGEINIFGLDNIKYEEKIKEEIGTVLDDCFFYPDFNATAIKKVMKNTYRNFDEKLFNEYLDKFKLPKNKAIKELSKGMNMKLKIAVALSHKPKLLILDEPTSGLDPIVRNEILDIFYDFIQDEEHSILLSSHITTDLEKIADYITFIDSGKIILSKTKDELIYKYGVIKCSEKDFRNIDKNDVVAYRKNDFSYEVLISDKNEIKRKYPSMIIDNTSLEDIMLFLVRGEKK